MIKMLSMIAILVLLASSIPLVVKGQTGSGEQIRNRTCKIMLILNDGNNTSDEEFNRTVAIVQQFPTFFKLAWDHLRLGYVVNSEAQEFMAAHDNEYFYRDFSFIRQRRAWHRPTAADLKFSAYMLKQDPDAFKIVILFTHGKTYADMDKTEQEAQRLKDDGIGIYVVFADAAVPEPGAKEHAICVTGHESRVIHIDEFFAKTTRICALIQTPIACRYEETCRFYNNTCVSDWWRPNSENVACDNPKPKDPFKLGCSHEKCVNVCDTTGKWKECKPGDEGKEAEITRDGAVPCHLKPIINHCPKTKKIRCPLRPRTSTTTTSPSTSTPRPESPESPGPHGTTAKGGVVGNVKPKESKSGVSAWIIPVAASVGGLALLIAVIAVIIVMQKKKKAKADALAKEMADQKKAVKSIHPKSSPVRRPIPERKPGADHAMAVSLKGADRAMNVSLREDESPQRRKMKSSGSLSRKSSSGVKSIDAGKDVKAGKSVKNEMRGVGKSVKAERSNVGKSVKGKSVVVAKKGSGK